MNARKRGGKIDISVRKLVFMENGLNVRKRDGKKTDRDDEKMDARQCGDGGWRRRKWRRRRDNRRSRRRTARVELHRNLTKRIPKAKRSLGAESVLEGHSQRGGSGHARGRREGGH